MAERDAAPFFFWLSIWSAALTLIKAFASVPASPHIAWPVLAEITRLLPRVAEFLLFCKQVKLPADGGRHEKKAEATAASALL